MPGWKVAVYAICKDEAGNVSGWMDSMQEADMVIVTDTGSVDDSVTRLQSRGALVYEIIIDPWRFDTARNISLKFVPDDVDICVCTDLDERFEPGWRAKLEKAWTPAITRMKYMYTWSFNPDGSPGVSFWYEKIHRRHGFKWIHPVNEVLEYYGDEPDIYAWDGSIQLNHYPNPLKPRSNYLSLLELSIQEDPGDDRNMHYLGREYMYYGMWDQCIEILLDHLEMPSAVWDEERAASMRYIANAYAAKGDHEEAKIWLYRAIAEAPHSREPYVEMAQLAYWQEDWPALHHMAEEALKINQRSGAYINESYAWDETIYDLGAISCYHLKMMDRAYEWINKAVQMSPHNERLRENLKIISAARGWRRFFKRKL